MTAHDLPRLKLGGQVGGGLGGEAGALQGPPSLLPFSFR